VWVEISPADAERLHVTEGDIVQLVSRRGSIQAPARVSGIREGVVFVPWHYGNDLGGAPGTAANDLTLGAWDPVSKQPEFKVAAVTVTRVAAGDGPAPAPTTTASAPVTPL
jgi:anaerobic selenocysteine-containing dehydrogenase